jgi:hypothetical protein
LNCSRFSSPSWVDSWSSLAALRSSIAAMITS